MEYIYETFDSSVKAQHISIGKLYGISEQFTVGGGISLGRDIKATSDSNDIGEVFIYGLAQSFANIFPEFYIVARYGKPETIMSFAQISWLKTGNIGLYHSFNISDKSSILVGGGAVYFNEIAPFIIIEPRLNNLSLRIQYTPELTRLHLIGTEETEVKAPSMAAILGYRF
jgi:hypothetical protein